jgi:hypothetical protein
MPMSPRLLRPKAAASTGFDPRAISGLAGWWDGSNSASLFDAASGGSNVAADGAVARWEDLSGNGRHLAQSVANNRPLRRIAAINGRDAVQFDGANDSMPLSPSIAMNTGASLIICIRVDSTANVGYHGFQGDAAPNAHPFNGTYFDSFANSTRQSWTQVPPTGVAHMYSIVAGADWRAYVNNALVRSATATLGNQAGSETQGFGMGRLTASFGPTHGWFCEMMFYSRDISISEQTALYNYIKAKWGTA